MKNYTFSKVEGRLTNGEKTSIGSLFAAGCTRLTSHDQKLANRLNDCEYGDFLFFFFENECK